MRTFVSLRTFFASKRAAWGLLALAFLASLQHSTALAQDKPDISIVGAKAYLGEGQFLENATIQIRDGKIKSIKANDPAAKDALIINAQGRWVTPGLVATETPMGLVELEAEASTVDTHIKRDHPIRSSYQPAKAVFANSSTFGMAMGWGVTSAAVTPTEGLVSGQVAWIDVLPDRHQDLVTDPSIAMRASLGQGEQGSRAATLEQLERLLDDAKLYKTKKRSHERGDLRPLAAPAKDLAALNDVLRRRQLLLLEVERASDILAALDLAKRFRIEIALVGAQEAWKVASAVAKAKVWVILRPTDNLPSSFARLGARLDNAAILHRAGVKLVIANIGSAHNAANLRQEAGIAVANGLPFAAALDAITLGPAQLFDLDRSYGSISPGKVANLVVWSDDPLEFHTRVHELIVRGEVQTTPTRQQLLRDRYLHLERFSPAKLPRFPVTNPVLMPGR